MSYKHLTREERYQIHSLRRQGVSLGCIAAELGRNRSTISRELRRNSAATSYKPALAHDKAFARQSDRQRARHFSAAQWAHVEGLMRLCLSPQQVSGRPTLDKAMCISTESIYQRACRDKAQGGDRHCRGTRGAIPQLFSGERINAARCNEDFCVGRPFTASRS